ncbi:MAG: hypothetical protein H0W76_02940 [Pyrinomonadaceae bacterium]|nr:hypothetical protein [Pyrinomonadaceae bacterium]
MSEKDALQSAADEARKAARAGREFAGILDDYAKRLTQPTQRQLADEILISAMNKLAIVNDGLAACSKWVEESGKPEVAPPPVRKIQREVVAMPVVLKEIRSNAVRVVKKGGGQ